MGLKDCLRALIKPAEPGTPRLDEILEPMTKAEIEARYAAAKKRMDAAQPLRRSDGKTED